MPRIRTRPRRAQREIVWSLVVVDAVAAALALACAAVVRLSLPLPVELASTDAERLTQESVLTLPLVLVLLRVYGMYDLERVPDGAREYSAVARAVTVAAVIGLAASYFAGRETLVSRSWLLVSWASCTAFVITGRIAARQVIRELRRRGSLRSRLVVVGASDLGIAAARQVSDPAEGYDVVGFLDEDLPLGQPVDGGLAVIGRPADLTRGADDLADEVVVVPNALPYDRLQGFVQQLVEQGRPVRLAPTSVPLLRRSPMTAFVKRALDVIGAVVGLAILSPLLTLIAIAVKLSSPGPVLYPWRVVGEGGRPFVGYKFRTMVENADTLKSGLLANNEMRGPVFKMRQDPRVTSIGRLLRRYSLDELPQLWSVLKGDMSLVGPRPPFEHEFASFTAGQRAKLSVKPGITCLWQISGRNEIHDFDDWVSLDLEYIRTWSLWLDLKILVKTLPAVITRRGAY